MEENGMSVSLWTNKRLKITSLGLVVAAALSIWAATAATATRPSAQATRTGSAVPSSLVAKLALARLATAKYVNDLDRAKADGYSIITRMIPTMGWHFLNGKIKGFDVQKPPILVYEHHGTSWQLAAVEWVFTAKPARPPLPGVTYGSFGAGCHYADGTFVPEESQDACPKTSPQTGTAFTFWHPLLITMHVWLWYPNPSGLFASTNPLVTPFNHG
jgi:hypothetical protein